jgi:hypothetical protein
MCQLSSVPEHIKEQRHVNAMIEKELSVMQKKKEKDVKILLLGTALLLSIRLAIRLDLF